MLACAPRQREGGPSEANLSAESNAPSAHAWLPQAHAQAGRSQGALAAARQGTPFAGTARPEEVAFRRAMRARTPALQRADFLRVTRRGRRTDTRYFQVFIQARLPADAPRLGITVTRKVGTAVRRN